MQYNIMLKSMKDRLLIAFTGDKGGVGKSTIAILLAEWLVREGLAVTVIDADPNQTAQTCVDKCQEQGYQISTRDAPYTIVDTAGTSGSSLQKYIRQADLILVPFQPHVADLETVVGWFLSLNEGLQQRVVFIPNRLAHTKEQREGLTQLQSVLSEQRRGKLAPGLSNRPAVYPPIFNGRGENFFHAKLDASAETELRQLFKSILEE
jgi:chromosome partitioning protein